MLRELTEPLQTIYFARRWRVVKDIPGQKARLQAMIDALDQDAAGTRAPSA